MPPPTILLKVRNIFLLSVNLEDVWSRYVCIECAIPHRKSMGTSKSNYPKTKSVRKKMNFRLEFYIEIYREEKKKYFLTHTKGK